MLGWLKRDREPRQGLSTSVLPDDLVVDIICRLQLKSICRSKCICKSWLAFSSDPYYSQKLRKTPAGLLYQKCEPGRLPWSLGTAIHLARLLGSDGEVNTRLNFLPPHYKYSKFVDCSNGLLLCCQGGNKDEAISNVIVCNPATKEWMAIPDPERGPLVYKTDLKFCFDPLWSQQFYVFKFQYITPLTEVEVFFSENSMWSGCLWQTEDAFAGDSPFVNGVLYVMHFLDHKILALDTPDISSQWLNHRIIQLPGFATRTDTFNCRDGCLSQLSGVLCYAQQELNGCALRIWSLECSDKWVVKHRVSVTDVFGKGLLVNTKMGGFWYFDYDILAVDLERELIILVDVKADKIISVSISTGKGSQFQKLSKKFTQLHHGLFYVPHYGEVPALALNGSG